MDLIEGLFSERALRKRGEAMLDSQEAECPHRALLEKESQRQMSVK